MQILLILFVINLFKKIYTYVIMERNTKKEKYMNQILVTKKLYITPELKESL